MSEIKHSFPSDDELVLFLNKKIDDELEKPVNEQDMDLIKEYTEFLDEIDGDKYRPNKEIMEQKLAELHKVYSQIKNKPALPLKRKFLKRILATVSAAAILLVLSVFTVATSRGISPLEVLNEWGKKYLMYLLTMQYTRAVLHLSEQKAVHFIHQ